MEVNYWITRKIGGGDMNSGGIMYQRSGVKRRSRGTRFDLTQLGDIG